jgi:oligoribonuclease NrnB/cAMP/cGMP phosphodiesterase (DHH superfamily)
VDLLLTHEDLDGIASIILIDALDLSFNKIISTNYGFEEEQKFISVIRDSKDIIVADIALTPEFHNELLAAGHSVRVFDHHDGTRWIAEKPGCVWDNKRSGAKIFFDEYVKPIVGRYKSSVREFIDLVDVYDRWDLESPLRSMSEDLQRVFVKYGNWGLDDNLARHDRFIAAIVKKFKKQDKFSWNQTELMYIQEAKKSEDKAYQEAMAMLQTRRDSKGRRFSVYSAWGKISMVCHRMLNIDKMDVSYIVCVQTFHGKLGQLSFRSREGEFDLTELAGVEGHKASAGASLSPEEIKRFMTENLCFRYKTDLKTDDEPIIERCYEIF